MSDPLWRADEIAAALGLETARDATGVSIDSRTLTPGDLFVALRDVRDGHDFVAAALAAGASAALVERRPEGVAADAPLLIVDDALEGLRALGAAARARADVKVVGVTGSVGKTGVKEMLRLALGAAGPVHAPEKSFNNHWGVPLTLARMPRDTRFAAIEMGMNHPGEITPLSRLARPDAAIITTIAPAHMAAFNSLEEIADAKAEIFAGLAPGGAAVLNRDNAQFAQLAKAAEAAGARVVSFGMDDGADARLDAVRLEPDACHIAAMIGGEEIGFRIGGAGAHIAMNAVAALAAARAVGVALSAAADGLSRWTPPEGRGSRQALRLQGGPLELIDESYNANPTSTRAALGVLGVSQPEGGRRVAFLGDMLELGAEERAMHAALAAADEIAPVDIVHTCGPLMRSLHEALPAEKRGLWFEDSAAMAAAAGDALAPGDVAMVKGSLGSRMARVIAAIRALDVSEAAHAV